MIWLGLYMMWYGITRIALFKLIDKYLHHVGAGDIEDELSDEELQALMSRAKRIITIPGIEVLMLLVFIKRILFN